MMKRTGLVVVAILLAVVATISAPAAHPARAQAALKYGDSVKGEVTAKQTEVVYTFTGKKDDVVIVQTLSDEKADSSSPLNAKVILSDASGAALVDSSKDYAKNFIGAYAETFFEKLPADGDYTITVTRDDAESEGGYTLELFQPTPLELGKEIEGKATYKGYSRYLAIYSVVPESGISVIYAQTDGDKKGAQVAIEAYENEFLSRKALLEGDGLLGGSMFIAKPTGLTFVTIAANGYESTELTLAYKLQVDALK